MIKKRPLQPHKSWHVGQRLLRDNLQDGRGEYGKQTLATVSRELTHEFGRGFSYAGISRMIQFVQVFPDEAIVATLSQQLSWSHFIELIPIKDPLSRDFYAEMCRIERWDVRTLTNYAAPIAKQRVSQLFSILKLENGATS